MYHNDDLKYVFFFWGGGAGILIRGLTTESSLGQRDRRFGSSLGRGIMRKFV